MFSGKSLVGAFIVGQGFYSHHTIFGQCERSEVGLLNIQVWLK